MSHMPAPPASGGDRIRILHLTDLHFPGPPALAQGRVGDSAQRFSDEVKTISREPLFRDKWVTSLHSLLSHLRPSQEAGFDLIGVTGDIAHQNNPQGRQDFAKFTAPLLARLLRRSGGERGFCLVPGNHDVPADLPPDKPDYFTQKFEGFRGLLEDIQQKAQIQPTTCLIPEGPMHSSDWRDELRFRSGRPWFYDPEQNLFVLCLNSAIRCWEHQHDPDSGVVTYDIAHITQTQRHHLVQELHAFRNQFKDEPRDPKDPCKSERAATWQSMLRVALLHHHPLPFPGQITEQKPFEGLVDAGLVLDIFRQFDFQVILCGHKHQHYVQKINFGRGDMLFVGGGAGTGVGGSLSLLEVSRSAVRGFDVQITNLEPAEQADYEGYVQTRKENSRRVHLEPAPPECLQGAGVDLASSLCSHAREAFDRISRARYKNSSPTDDSDRYILFCNSNKPNDVRDRLIALSAGVDARKLRIEGIYDLFGSKDLLVKIWTKNPALLEPDLIEPLKPMVKKFELVNVTHEYLVATEGSAAPPAGLVGSASRGIRAFVYFEKVRNARRLEQLVTACRKVCDGNARRLVCHPVLLNQLYRMQVLNHGGSRLLAEYSVGCGGFYDVAQAVVAIEKEIGSLESKTTLLAMTVWEDGRDYTAHERDP